MAARNDCLTEDAVYKLMSKLNSSYVPTMWASFNGNKTLCTNNTTLTNDTRTSDHILLEVYIILNPLIILIGIVGNSLSLYVFCSALMRRLFASLYLAALAVSDTLVLFTYIVEWLNKGVARWQNGLDIDPINTTPGCHLFLYCLYTFRFISAWLIVAFTLERFIAVYWPLHRKRICTRRFAWRQIIGVCVVGGILCLFKPIMNHVRMPTAGKVVACMPHEELTDVSHIFDIIYGVFAITLIPFFLISCFNIFILRHLRKQNRTDRAGEGLTIHHSINRRASSVPCLFSNLQQQPSIQLTEIRAIPQITGLPLETDAEQQNACQKYQRPNCNGGCDADECTRQLYRDAALKMSQNQLSASTESIKRGSLAHRLRNNNCQSSLSVEYKVRDSELTPNVNRHESRDHSSVQRMTSRGIRVEFTFALLLVSIFFLILNLPYLTVWCLNLFQRGSMVGMTHVQSVTRAIFSLNYSINFFLYCLTGVHFRRQMCLIFTRRSKRVPITGFTCTELS